MDDYHDPDLFTIHRTDTSEADEHYINSATEPFERFARRCEVRARQYGGRIPHEVGKQWWQEFWLAWEAETDKDTTK